MKKSKWSLLLTLVLVLSVFLSACSGKKAATNNTSSSSGGNTTATTGSSSGPKVLNLLDSSEIPTLDSVMADDEVSITVANNIYEGLYTLDDNDKPIPAGIEGEPTIKDGGKTWDFKLRSDAKWSNGDPVTASDYVYSWHKAVAKDTADTYNFIYGVANILNADKIIDPTSPMFGKVDQLGVKALDDHTLEVKFSKDPSSIPYLKSVLSFPTFYPQPEKYIQSQGKNYGKEAANDVYNGPYVLSSWEHEKGWTYKKNPNYWDKANVKIDQINVNIVKDQATALNLYDTGKVDRSGVTAEYVDKYKGHPDFSTIPGTAVYFLRFNEKNKYLSNPDIRHALDMGWDKKQLADVLLNNGSIPAYFLVPKQFVTGPDGQDFRAKNGDMDKGTAAQAKAYWEKGLKELGTNKITLTLLNYDKDSAQTDAQFIKNQLEKNLPGLTLNIKPQPFKQKLKLEETANYDLSYAGWGPDYPDPMTFVDMFLTNDPHNEMNYSNKKYDALIKDAQNQTDLQKRWSDMQDAEKILVQDDAAISPMYQRGSAYVTKPYVKNIKLHAFGGDYSFKNWDIQK